MKIFPCFLCLLWLLVTIPVLAQVKPSPAKSKSGKTVSPKKQKMASEDASEQSTERSANEDAKVEANDHADSPDAAVTTATTRPAAPDGNGDPYLRLATAGSFVSEAIRFEPGAATLRDGSLDDLNGIGEVLLERDSLSVEIGVYSEADEAIAQSRAETLKAHLVGLGIAAERLRAKGYGKATRQRVEFVKK